MADIDQLWEDYPVLTQKSCIYEMLYVETHQYDCGHLSMMGTCHMIDRVTKWCQCIFVCQCMEVRCK